MIPFVISEPGPMLLLQGEAKLASKLSMGRGNSPLGNALTSSLTPGVSTNSGP